ncbi:cytochrome c oxidase subunit II [Anatilimnocola sp. NA78]|uniref:cytochrome c oxidase subunit II n=1 Tax=Anatilimnocola sp. NA78 TaxID=3415683 RepID=UPI003CE4BC48
MEAASPLTTLSLLAFAGEPVQSMVHPAGPAAAEIASLWWIMFGAFTGVFVLVIVLMMYAIWWRPAPASAREPAAPPGGRTGFIIAGGVVLPIVVLTPLFVYSLLASARLQMPEDAQTIRVVGHMWWWEVRYPDHGIVTANEIHIPAGEPVRLELTSADVIHSFWVPRLHGKRDMIPGIKTEFWIQADEPGVYRGQCGEYCGTQHANMALEVIALAPDDFAEWLKVQSQQRTQSESPAIDRGRQVFLTAGCKQCHAIEGTTATGNAGPDLTHLGSRRMIGSALLPNTAGNLAGWIADPQALKPGVKMPRTYLEAEESQALVTYLESLK